MNQFKRAQCIMLPTKDNGIIDTYDNGKICLTKEKTDWSWKRGFKELYIISDDEIKEGDWVLGGLNDIVEKWQNNFTANWKKIIATTNNSLVQSKQIIGRDEIGNLYNPIFLPQPSQEFIEKYIESYNKNEIITDVLVECFYSSGGFSHINNIKVNPKDNTITIKKLKDSWNRKEVIKLIKSFANNYQYASNDIGYNKWIEENL